MLTLDRLPVHRSADRTCRHGLPRSGLLHPLLGILGLVLAPLCVLGSLEFVGPFEPRGWKPAGTLVPLANIGWSRWLPALEIGFLVTA
jgi:hypothetical protein